MANVSIKFNNKEYLLSCDDGQEENLKELAMHLDSKYIELKKNRLRAAFDVYWKEPYNGKLKDFYPDNFFMTPHVASTTATATATATTTTATCSTPN